MTHILIGLAPSRSSLKNRGFGRVTSVFRRCPRHITAEVPSGILAEAVDIGCG